MFFEWINPVYLGPAAQGSIQEKFEHDSEIELQDFLQVGSWGVEVGMIEVVKRVYPPTGPVWARVGLTVLLTELQKICTCIP